MARNNSFIKLEGTIDGLTFYRQNGESLVKKVSTVSKSRIMNDPAYKRTRENMSEFGGAATVGKIFRDAFAATVKLTADSYLSARVSGLMKRVNSLGDGLRGERSINLVTYGSLFKGFEFNKVRPLKTRFYAPYTLPSFNATRDVATWTVPDFNTDSFVRAPEGATHFKLVLATGYVSDYDYSPATRRYEPVDDSANSRGGVMYSEALALGGMVGSDTTLEVDLSALGAIPDTTAAFCGMGVLFFQEQQGVFYELAQGHAFVMP